ncbi:hypothetical protein DFP91_5808 [Pseudorhodoplanes sinuspersici]|uniref:Uncharacterized protein n=1 Tax=Pseudorhodoplanes sinuspersici TaxID=1235591 RepID=A0A1W6ZLW3_9HYPH|nr:hypothetical protein CAK95_03530 [Pseudorhodoplanes sinuspersici]RKE65765.1 hypothetical protein DFP91_5808 [Pseudorhodoplanes sinuspersici]
MTYIKAWLIPWEPGQIGIGYTNEVGQTGTRELRQRDPDFVEFCELLGPFDQIRMTRHLNKVIAFKPPR